MDVKYDIGQSWCHSECTVHTVTVSVGSDSYRHVTEVTYDTGNSGSHGECTVRKVTVSAGRDTHGHVTEVMYVIWSFSCMGLPHIQQSATPSHTSAQGLLTHSEYCMYIILYYLLISM